MARKQHVDATSTTDGSIRHRIGDHTAIYKTPKSPNWYIDFSLDGKQYRYSLKTSSKKRAERLAKNKDAELTLGVARKPVKVKVSIMDAADKYAESVKQRGKVPDTYETYRRDVRQLAYFARARGIFRLEDVSADLLEAFQKQLETDGVDSFIPEAAKKRELKRSTPGTARGKLKHVRQLIRWAIKRRLIHEDPAPGYQLPPKIEEEAFCWTRAQLRSIREKARAPFQDIFDFFTYTGLRSSELCWLLKEDICLADRPFVRIRHKRCPVTGKSWWPKKKKHRIVPLVPQAAEIARRYQSKSDEPWLFPCKRWLKNPAGRYQPTTILSALRRAMDAADIAEGRTHTFRHVFCSFMANQKVPPLQVMKILGHGSLDIVLIYYHLDDDELLNALTDVEFSKLTGTSRKGADLADS